MDVLILGGTRFLGRALVESALARGHRVTLFHRGRTGAALFPEIERILGDRERGLERLAGRRWDAVFDTCGFVPRIVRANAERLAGSAGHYTFVSSISVYADPVAPGSDERAPLAKLADERVEQVTGETYGGLKALCEGVVETAFPGRALHARLGLLVGPHDYTDRFPYWVTRIARGGDVLVPDAPDQPVQFIDARDAAGWMVRMAEARTAGVFNLTGPLEPLALGGFFAAARAALASDARFVPVAGEFLKEQGVVPWTELPLWTAGDVGFVAVKTSRAVANGLAFRPLAETIRDTLAWRRVTPASEGAGSTLATPVPASLSADRERELLGLWASRSRR